MLGYLSLALMGYLLYWTLQAWAGLRRNIALAKATGLPYHISPLDGMPGYIYLATEHLWAALLKSIPYVKNTKWPILFTVHRGYGWGQRNRELLGEAYLIVSPSMIYLNCTDRDGIMQISNRRHDFVKPQELYGIVDIFGENILSAEGETWKRHRKIVAPAFAERSNLLVWKESLFQANGLITAWASVKGNTQEVMRIANPDVGIAHLALHVISGAGFGVRQLFQGVDEKQLKESLIPGFNTKELSEGHTYTFKDALQTVVHNIFWLMLLPRWILERSPFELHKKLIRAHFECANYFKELANYKSDLIDRGNMVDARTMDIMAPLVRASQKTPEESKGLYLTKQEVTADSWILLFAGHETTANTLHFTMLLLATEIATQKELQQEIESIVGEKPQPQWTYEEDMAALYNSLVGACFSEALRLLPPVAESAKVCRPHPQPIIIKGKTHILPAHTFVHADLAGAHRCPDYWPHSPSKISHGNDDILDFVPQRWIRTSNEKTNQNEASTDADNIDGLEKASFIATTGGLFVPPKGAYLPFAEGGRSCPGRRFAQVEMTAVLATLFKDYSVELDVSKFATDEEVERMSKAERKVVYDKARVQARKDIHGSIYTIALKMFAPCPVRIVRRGKERFFDVYE